MRPPRHRLLVLPLLALFAAILLGACAAEAPPDPSAPCNGADSQQAAGFYPELEQLVPHSLPGFTANGIASGRFCSSKALGSSLYDAGIHELHYGASSWVLGEDKKHGVALIVYRAQGLTLDMLADSFAKGAGSTQGAAGITATKTTIAGQQGVRITAVIEALNESVFVWPGTTPNTMNTVTAVGTTDAELESAVGAFSHPGT